MNGEYRDLARYLLAPKIKNSKKIKSPLDLLDIIEYLKNMKNENTTTTNPADIQDTDSFLAMCSYAGNIPFVLDEEEESFDGRYELFGQYEN
jgi:hypothetical protein